MKYTSECVSAWHVDKICDQISDAIVDECLKQDPESRVAVETALGHGIVHLTGEITTKAVIDYKKVAKDYYKDLTGKNIEVTTAIKEQSPDIAQGVNNGGAGDQGIMYGYACSETSTFMPLEMSIARWLLNDFNADAKSQVTIDNETFEISDIVLSVANKTQEELIEFLKKNFQSSKINFYCNPTGKFEVSGDDCDSGVTGRKIVIDQYGTRVPVGGGAFSGKDPTKVDRSGAYMARWVAIQELKKTASKEVLIRVAYAIGKAEPLEVTAIRDGVAYDISKEYDFRPQSIIKKFDLKRPIYAMTAKYGHFGIKDLPWEQY